MMKSSDESFLSHVEEDDIARVLFEDITDPSHKARYEHFARTNPELTREIMRRAGVAARNAIGDQGLRTTIEVQKIIIDSVTFALSALETAVKRQSSIGDGAGANQPRSDELGDGRPKP